MPYHLENAVSPRSQIYRQLSDYYKFCEQTRQMTSATMLGKIYAINNFVKFTGLNDLRKISNQMIIDWINSQIARQNSGRSVNDRLAHLKALLRWQTEMQVKMPHLQLPLIPRVKEAPPRKVYFTRHQVQTVLAKANPLEWLLISLAFDCGLRITELCNLRRADLHSNSLDIIGKGRKRRHAYLSIEVMRRLSKWIKANRITNYLWPSPIFPDKPIAVCTVRDYMRRAFARVGIEDFCPHDLRHSYATDLKRLGIPTRQIQAGLGHSTEKVTEQYLSDLDGYDLIEMYRIKYAAQSTDCCDFCNTN